MSGLNTGSFSLRKYSILHNINYSAVYHIKYSWGFNSKLKITLLEMNNLVFQTKKQ